MARYQLTTIERSSEGVVERHDRNTHNNLAALVRLAKRLGWLPGSGSGTGLTIVETVFESVT